MSICLHVLPHCTKYVVRGDKDNKARNEIDTRDLQNFRLVYL